MAESPSEFAGLIDRYAKTDGVHGTPIPRVFLIRSARPTLPLHTLYEPAVCIIAQGRKQAILGDAIYVYDRDKYLVISVDVPVVGQIIDASEAAPYLCLRLDLDVATLGTLLLDAGPAPSGMAPAPALSLSSVTPELIDAVIRLLRLLDTPEDIPVLAPLAEREILFRLLRGDQTAKLREIALGDSKLRQINRAIGFIKENYRETLRIEDLSDVARMSASALHSHFKSVTAMSPLQFQKQLRLQEARRLGPRTKRLRAKRTCAASRATKRRLSSWYSKCLRAGCIIPTIGEAGGGVAERLSREAVPSPGLQRVSRRRRRGRLLPGLEPRRLVLGQYRRRTMMGSKALEEQGFTRIQWGTVQAPMPEMGHVIKTSDHLWKIVSFIRSINPPGTNPPEKVIPGRYTPPGDKAAE